MIRRLHFADPQWLPSARLKFARPAIVSLLALFTSVTGLNAEPLGTAREFAIALPPRVAGFPLKVDDLLRRNVVFGKTAFVQQTENGSTAGQWRTARQAKRTNLAVPEKTDVEAGVVWIDTTRRRRGGWHGFVPAGGGFPSGAGPSFRIIWNKEGIGVRYPDELTPNRVDLQGSVGLSLRGYYLGLFEGGWQRIGGTPVHMNFHVGYQHNANESFYGLGKESVLEDRAGFSETMRTGGVVLLWQSPSWFYVGGGIGYRDTKLGEGNNAYRSLRDVNLGQLPGDVEQAEHIAYDGFAQVDWRNKGYHYRGGLYAIRWSDWRDRKLGAFNFKKLDIEVQQYLPFLMNKRVIAFRARAILTDTEPGQEVPFYLMPTLGGTRDLRGFNHDRFRDRNMILLNVEYRTEIWAAMDLALFVDTGKVFREHSDINLMDLSTDYGIGLRLKSTLATFLRADFAFGDEGFHTAIRAGSSFDSPSLFGRLLQVMQ